MAPRTSVALYVRPPLEHMAATVEKPALVTNNARGLSLIIEQNLP